MWFDSWDACERIRRMHQAGELGSKAAEDLLQWVRDGYIIIRSAAAPDVTDELSREMEQIWVSSSPVEGLRLEMLERTGSHERPVTHRELLALDENERAELRRSSWRIHSFEESFSGAAAKLVAWIRSLDIVPKLVGSDAEVMNTITFMYGSEQELHQDWAVAHILPRGGLIGVWVALEDVHADAGPLVYYPGTHRLPPFPGFRRYPEVSLKNCDSAARLGYETWIANAVQGRTSERFLATRGDVIVWHAGLIHGGHPISASRRFTRRSFVCHLTMQDANKVRQLRPTM